MIKFITRFISQFKEYFLLVLLIIVSLSVLSSNEKPQVKRIRTFALGSFAIFSEAVNSLSSIFHGEPSTDELRRENANLMLEVNRLRNYKIENESLRTLLSFRDTASYPLIYADVVSKLVNKVQGNFIINRGISSGLKVGMPVLNEKGLIGIITETSDQFSVVKTLYNSNLNIAVTIQNIKVDGVLSWNGSELIIKNIPTTYNVRVGDAVVTSDFSSLFPPGIPVGTVSKRETISLGLLHSISITPYADIYSVDNLFIMMLVTSKEINKLEMNLMK
ncbi:MAG: rod shape-determining protein MreC [Bacteroidota bacterium]